MANDSQRDEVTLKQQPSEIFTHADMVGVTAYRLLRGEDFEWIARNCIGRDAAKALANQSDVAAAYAALFDALERLERLFPNEQLEGMWTAWQDDLSTRKTGAS